MKHEITEKILVENEVKLKDGTLRSGEIKRVADMHAEKLTGRTIEIHNRTFAADNAGNVTIRQHGPTQKVPQKIEFYIEHKTTTRKGKVNYKGTMQEFLDQQRSKTTGKSTYLIEKELDPESYPAHKAVKTCSDKSTKKGAEKGAKKTAQKLAAKTGETATKKSAQKGFEKIASKGASKVFGVTTKEMIKKTLKRFPVIGSAVGVGILIARYSNGEQISKQFDLKNNEINLKFEK